MLRKVAVSRFGGLVIYPRADSKFSLPVMRPWLLVLRTDHMLGLMLGISYIALDRGEHCS